MRLPDEHPVQKIADMVGGEITAAGVHPDGSSGYAVVSMPLRPDHWIYQKDPTFDAPPMPLKCGTEESIACGVLRSSGEAVIVSEKLSRQEFASRLREAARYAVKVSTMHGSEMDFDPDALVQNFVVGMLGYFTPDGLAHEDDWANPPKYREPRGRPAR